MNWEDKISVKKGNLGERIVRQRLESSGYIVYGALTSGAHAFDFLAVKDKRKIIIAEVKSKARMNKFACTGINVRNYEEYIYISKDKGLDVVLFFVDEHPSQKNVYCGLLSELTKPKIVEGVKYPNFKISDGIVMFSLSDMYPVCDLKEEELEKLKQYSGRSYGYVTSSKSECP